MLGSIPCLSSDCASIPACTLLCRASSRAHMRTHSFCFTHAQSIYEDVARDTNRGHTVEAVKECFVLAKDAGFKVGAVGSFLGICHGGGMWCACRCLPACLHGAKRSICLLHLVCAVWRATPSLRMHFTTPCFCMHATTTPTDLQVVCHMMPDLPNVGWERDVECFREFFENPDFRSDGLKLYPTLVIRGERHVRTACAKVARALVSVCDALVWPRVSVQLREGDHLLACWEG